jgi:hypothetical protein
MRKLALILTLAALPCICLISCAQENKGVGPGGASQIVVPKGKTYVKLDAKGKEIARYSAGQVMAVTVDCVIIPCPSTFPKDYVCWQCKARAPEPAVGGGYGAASHPGAPR